MGELLDLVMTDNLIDALLKPSRIVQMIAYQNKHTVCKKSRKIFSRKKNKVWALKQNLSSFVTDLVKFSQASRVAIAPGTSDLYEVT